MAFEGQSSSILSRDGSLRTCPVDKFQMQICPSYCPDTIEPAPKEVADVTSSECFRNRRQSLMGLSTSICNAFGVESYIFTHRLQPTVTILRICPQTTYSTLVTDGIE